MNKLVWAWKSSSVKSLYTQLLKTRLLPPPPPKKEEEVMKNALSWNPDKSGKNLPFLCFMALHYLFKVMFSVSALSRFKVR